MYSILEKDSKLEINNDFFVISSPERVVPGSGIDISDLKIVSGSNEQSAKKIESLYSSVIKAGVFLASNKVAGAAKVINYTKGINTALVNELSMIFNEQI